MVIKYFKNKIKIFLLATILKIKKRYSGVGVFPYGWGKGLHTSIFTLINIDTYINTHTHTHTQRERERERETNTHTLTHSLT